VGGGEISKPCSWTQQQGERSILTAPSTGQFDYSFTCAPGWPPTVGGMGSPEPNTVLRTRMRAAGMTEAELAEEMNRVLLARTSRSGDYTDRTIRRFLSGQTRWPQSRAQLALATIFRSTAQELGFIDPRKPRQGAEDPVRRRDFASNAIGLAAASVLPLASTSASLRVGMADADRLESAFAQLVHADNQYGGTVNLETRALAFAHHAMELQAVGHATQRVRARLYYLAAAFTGTALWATVDSHEPQRAQRHLDRAMTLAGMSGNREVVLRLWGHAAVLANQQKNRQDALAAGQAGRASSACRTDPLYRSLAAARLAAVQAGAGERTGALRSFELACAAFEQADHAEQRPSWMNFYDRSELDGLGALVMARIGEHDKAEAQLHRTLARLRPEYARNRAFYSAHLALAQLRQGDVEQACTTAIHVLPANNGDTLTGRNDQLLGAFTRELTAKASNSHFTMQWKEQYYKKDGGRR
jgi:tetratricopeptide (TPR) repeat protein